MAETTETLLYQVPLASVQGGHHTARVGAREILIVDTAEGLRVYDGVCPHLGGPLLEGRVLARAILCPWHGYAFDLVSGRCLTTPGGIWRAGGFKKGDGQPMGIALRPLRHELKDGVVFVYGQPRADQRPAPPNT
jgi:nitrite reductase/ring-hydroxylating ferredoxin subunit